MALPCAVHPEVGAEFRCSGCRRALCPACVEVGHRLWFCRHCRERALPIGEAATSTPVARDRRRQLDRPYSLGEALRYVFRGGGALALPAYVLFLTAAALLPGAFALLPPAAVALFLPGYLFEIVRATGAGEDEMPHWPDYADLRQPVAEWLQTAGILAAAALPVLFLRRLARCDVESFLVADPSLCHFATAAGGALGFALALFGLGAVGTWSSGWLSFRIDLHLEALLSGTRGQAPAFVGAVAALLGAALAAAKALAGIPLLGLVVLHATTGYALFTSAHLAGVLFRRHREKLASIYLA